MGWGRIKVDGIFKDAKKEEASWLFEGDKAATWWSFIRRGPPLREDSDLLTPFLLSKHDKTLSTQFLVFYSIGLPRWGC